MQGTQYATKRSILCRGAFCGPTRLPNVCNVTSQGNNKIKLTYCDEAKKRALNS